jgi:hypothetical protein
LNTGRSLIADCTHEIEQHPIHHTIRSHRPRQVRRAPPRQRRPRGGNLLHEPRQPLITNGGRPRVPRARVARARGVADVGRHRHRAGARAGVGLTVWGLLPVGRDTALSAAPLPSPPLQSFPHPRPAQPATQQKSAQVVGLSGGERFTAMLPVPANWDSDQHLVMATSKGAVKRTQLTSFSSLKTAKRRCAAAREGSLPFWLFLISRRRNSTPCLLSSTNTIKPTTPQPNPTHLYHIHHQTPPPQRRHRGHPPGGGRRPRGRLPLRARRHGAAVVQRRQGGQL